MPNPVIDQIKFTNETYDIRDNSVTLYSRMQKIEQIVGTSIETSEQIIDSIVGGESNG